MKSEQKQLQQLKAKLEKEYGRVITDEEATHAYQLVKLLAQITADDAYREADRNKRLQENPKGFHLDGNFTCIVCGQPAKNENSWYDKNGIKCMPCQKALNKKLIPKSVINKDSWYSKYDLERYFNINRIQLTKYVKSGLLKKRIVPLEGNRTYLELFLTKDNKDLLPPKKLLPTKFIKVMKNEEEYYTRAEWYECIDEKGLKKLLKYKIGEILKETFANPIKAGRFYWKGMISLLFRPIE